MTLLLLLAILAIKRTEKLVKCAQRKHCILLKLHYIESYQSHYGIFFKCLSPLGIGRKLNVRVTFRRHPGRLM